MFLAVHKGRKITFTIAWKLFQFRIRSMTSLWSNIVEPNEFTCSISQQLGPFLIVDFVIPRNDFSLGKPLRYNTHAMIRREKEMLSFTFCCRQRCFIFPRVVVGITFRRIDCYYKTGDYLVKHVFRDLQFLQIPKNDS